MNDHNGRYTRIRYAAVGALAALAAGGAIAAVSATAGTDPPASKPPVRVTGPAQSVPPALQNAVQQLVSNGTITAAQGHTLDSDIKASTVHADQLASQGFTQTQIEAIGQMLTSAKLQLAAGAHGSASTSTGRKRHSPARHRVHPRHRRS
jgi:hypothetical protein